MDQRGYPIDPTDQVSAPVDPAEHVSSPEQRLQEWVVLAARIDVIACVPAQREVQAA